MTIYYLKTNLVVVACVYLPAVTKPECNSHQNQGNIYTNSTAIYVHKVAYTGPPTRVVERPPSSLPESFHSPYSPHIWMPSV